MKKKTFLYPQNVLLLLVAVLFFLLHPSSVSQASPAVPSSIIRLPENETAILVEKKTQTLLLYASRAQDLFVLFQTPCSTGEAYGIKQKTGDRRTPEGVYFLKDEYEDKYLSAIYGQKAFPTDYPNFIDKKAGKNGSAIWIHGTNKKLKPMDSNGCIALENPSIIKVSDYITLDSTPVIMVEKIDLIDSALVVKQKNAINHMLDQWMAAVENGSYHDYLSFYSARYFPEINWWEQWLTIREKAKALDFKLSVERERTGIYFHNQVFVVLFDFFLTHKKNKIALGKRKFFLEKQDKAYRIIGDVFQRLPKNLQTSKTPLVTAAKTFVKPVLKKETVLETIYQWLAAWSAKDMDTYASFYAPNFFSDGMNKKTWVKRKRKIAEKYAFITVSGREFRVKQQKETCEVSFFQEYASNVFATQGTKKLKLVNKGGAWKIYRESWKEK